MPLQPTESVFFDDFNHHELDLSNWIPAYLPQWASSEATKLWVDGPRKYNRVSPPSFCKRGKRSLSSARQTLAELAKLGSLSPAGGSPPHPGSRRGFESYPAGLKLKNRPSRIGSLILAGVGLEPTNVFLLHYW